ncbi:putative glycerol-3-phosphate acyltransferase PlsY [Streptococcus acidominimus]|uniref:Glycerol-3-phosphate acyltransferase n=1 Tax=Streptococcus acidominimus TaxID=1326 RepID=A0A239X3E6_STRAI|nr:MULTISPECIES: glycerol-3-phosphate 1-O-acyltransferase PlsY [Streptococcus]SNV41281.1 putative glycerol-3-phosphate acyltransferase PlsY [Streptococcus acidominimus]
MKTILLVLIAYLLGSIPTGLWIGKYIYHINLRDFGSGNMGTTNTFRILGQKAGLVTLAVDLLKGTLAVLIAVWCHSSISPLLVGFFAIIGHTYPVFAQFKGGKAVATSAGVLLGFAPLFLTYLFVLFVITLFLSSMISFTSITVSIIAALSVLLFPAFDIILTGYDLLFTIVVLAMAAVIVLRHQDNIKRIKAKKENIVPFGLNLTKQHPKS